MGPWELKYPSYLSIDNPGAVFMEVGGSMRLKIIVILLISFPSLGCQLTDSSFRRQLINIQVLATKAEGAEEVQCYRSITIPRDGSTLETGWVCKPKKDWQR